MGDWRGKLLCDGVEGLIRAAVALNAAHAGRR
jgi:hypothetical protein